MAVTIVRANEAIDVKNVVVLIYGQPGVGKSSMGFTAKRVLTLDFDKGAHRSGFRKDILIINSWNDVQELLKDNSTLNQYDCLVIDTVGRCLDFIIQSFDRSTNKLVTRNGNPTMQGWGELKGIFQNFIRHVTTLGKDIVLIAHEKEDKDGDQTVLRPDVSGGSYAEVFKVADFVGRVFKIGKQTTLDFEPCEKWLGKNSASINAIDVPNFVTEPEFLGNLLSIMKQALGKNAEVQKASVDSIGQYRSSIEQCRSVEDLNKILTNASGEEPAMKKQIKTLADRRAKDIGAKFDATQKRYVILPPVNGATPKPTTPAPEPEQPKQPEPTPTTAPVVTASEGDDW